MKNICIVIHGGAGLDSDFIRSNLLAYKAGLNDALEAGYQVLVNNGSAVDAVEAAVVMMENNPLFNCAVGSALNEHGEVEMCSSIMDGDKVRGGAIAIVKEIKNPVSLAKAVMQHQNCLYLGAEGALKFAKKNHIETKHPSYFITPHQFEEYTKRKNEELKESSGNEGASVGHGTVGAVAVDFQGNIASATSTGGLEYCEEGRISDSGMIGVGCYANNTSCAVSGTGDGEYMIRGVICHSVACAVKLEKLSVQEACQKIINQENSHAHADLGVIAIDCKSNIGIAFNSERMHRGYKNANETIIQIYKTD